MNRFELERAITQCFQTSEDLDLLFEKILNEDLDNNDFADIVLGIKKLNDLRCQKVFDIMEYMISHDQM